MLWALNGAYFERKCFDAWHDVPFYSTSRTPFSGQIAQLVLTFMRDYEDHFDYDSPFYILELGGGLGCFAYRFLNELLEAKDHFARLKNLRVRYILTDGSRNVVESYPAMLRLSEHTASGVLDFSIFRPEKDEEISCMISGERLEKGNIVNPVAVLANYFFDSTRHDAFRINGGKLSEVRYSLFGQKENQSEENSDALEMIESYQDCPIDYYEESAVNDILKYYCSTLGEASILLPTDAFRIIDNLKKLANNKLLLLATDKGFTSLKANQVLGARSPDFGSRIPIFFDVNFDAIARYWTSELGGKAWTAAGDHVGLCSFLAMTDLVADCEGASHMFESQFIERDSLNGLFNLEHVLHQAEISLRKDLGRANLFRGLIQTFNFEPTVFTIVFDKMQDELLTELPRLGAEERAELTAVLKRVFKNIYLIDPAFDALDGIFRSLFALGDLEQCLAICESALALFGPQTTILDHYAMCYERLGQKTKATDYLLQSFTFDPTHQWARDAYIRLGGGT